MIDPKLNKIIADWVHGSNIFITKNDLQGFLQFSWESFKQIMPGFEEMERTYKRIGFKNSHEQRVIQSYETAKAAFDDFVIRMFDAFTINTDKSIKGFVEHILQTLEKNKVL